jgi:hypothetical protein
MPRRRAASVARRTSALIVVSLRILEVQSTTEQTDLIFDANEDARLSALQERVSCVLERREQLERLVELVTDIPGRLLVHAKELHAYRRLATTLTT